MIVNLTCDMLVDQDRYIGDAPVGYSCGNAAVTTVEIDGKHYLICDHCLCLSRDRLTVYAWIGGESRQARIDDAKQKAVDRASEFLAKYEDSKCPTKPV